MRTIVAAALVVLAGCGGGAARTAWSGPPPEVVRALQEPENPYRIIYSPPVDLAKRPTRK